MKTKIILLGIILGFFIISLSSMVIADDHNEGSELRRGELILWAEALIFLFFITAVILSIMILRQHASMNLRVPHIFILAGIVLFGLTRIMYTLYEFKILDIGDQTLEFWWHLIFYLGTFSFLIASNKIIEFIDGKKLKNLLMKDIIVLCTLSLVTLALFLTIQPLNEWFLSWFKDSLIDNGGFEHFIAFLFLGVVAFKFGWIKFSSYRTSNKRFKVIDSLLGGFVIFFIFLTLLSLNHFWELLTESWGIIRLPENVIESVEQFFWLPAFMSISYGLWRTYRKVRK